MNQDKKDQRNLRARARRFALHFLKETHSPKKNSEKFALYIRFVNKYLEAPLPRRTRLNKYRANILEGGINVNKIEFHKKKLINKEKKEKIDGDDEYKNIEPEKYEEKIVQTSSEKIEHKNKIKKEEDTKQIDNIHELKNIEFKKHQGFDKKEVKKGQYSESQSKPGDNRKIMERFAERAGIGIRNPRINFEVIEAPEVDDFELEERKEFEEEERMKKQKVIDRYANKVWPDSKIIDPIGAWIKAACYSDFPTGKRTLFSTEIDELGNLIHIFRFYTKEKRRALQKLSDMRREGGPNIPEDVYVKINSGLKYLLTLEGARQYRGYEDIAQFVAENKIDDGIQHVYKTNKNKKNMQPFLTALKMDMEDKKENERLIKINGQIMLAEFIDDRFFIKNTQETKRLNKINKDKNPKQKK